MRLDSAAFLLLALAVVIFGRLGRGKWRFAVLAAANVVFLFSFSTNPLSLLPLLGFVLCGYGAILMAGRFPGAALLGALITGLVGLFMWIRHYSILSPLPDLAFVYSTVGLSYVLFRVIHLTVDVSQGMLRPPGPTSYLMYVFFFLSFSSGPVQRYPDFQLQMQTRPAPLSITQITAAIHRILLGYFLLTVVDAACEWAFGKLAIRLTTALALHDMSSRTLILLAAIAPAYMLHVFANFSAYMHIVIGVGRLAGIELPENFHFPFATRSFLNFWSRWHITLSEWFRDYMFNPLLKSLLTIPLPPAWAPYLAAIAFFATFGVIGLWHGTSFAFIVLGLMFGFGASLNKLWQIMAPKYLGKQGYKALCRTGWYLQLCRGLTLSYIAISLTCVWIPPEGLGPLLSREGLVLAISAVLLLTAVGAGLSFLWDAKGAINLPRLDPEQAPLRAAAWTALLIFIVLNLALAVNSASDIVYKDF
jgi:alginate O-acetyltransferase complex protein AlgI